MQVRRAHSCCTVAAVMVVHIVGLRSRNRWFMPSLSGKILVIPRADRSFTDRGRTAQEHLHATPLVQFVERFQVHPCPDCEYLAGGLKCDNLGALLVWSRNKSLDLAALLTWGRGGTLRICLATCATMPWTWCTSFFLNFLRQNLIMSHRHGRQRLLSLLYDLAVHRSLQAAQLFSVGTTSVAF